MRTLYIAIILMLTQQYCYAATGAEVAAAMADKYGARVGTVGDTIVLWEHDSIPQPSDAQVVLDVTVYLAQKSADDAARKGKETALKAKLGINDADLVILRGLLNGT